MMQIEKDYYKDLGLARTATTGEIRQNYRMLARLYHPDVSQEAQTVEKFQAVQEAYEILGDRTQREKYNQWCVQQGHDQPSALNLQVTTSHQTLSPIAEEQAYYVRLEITSIADLPAIRLPLNLCLVVDRSTSMQGARLKYVKEALGEIIDQLQPEDALSLVVFSDRAEVLLPGQVNIDKALAKSVAAKIQPGGSTEMLPGLLLGLKEIERKRSRSSVNHIILLTDGQTYGDEAECLQQAQEAELRQISLSAIGIGSDWNEDFLDKLTSFSNGISTYIDSPQKVKSIFEDTVRHLKMVLARQLMLTINLGSGVHLHEAFQITPQIRRLEIPQPQIELGTLSAEQGKSLLFEFRVRDLQPGERRLVRIKVESDIPRQAEYRAWESVDLAAEVGEMTNLPADVPAEITTVLSTLAIFKMHEKVFSDLESNKIKTATHRLEIMATRLLDLGETNLAQAALLEAGRLAKAGVLSAAGPKTIKFGARALRFVT